MISGTTIGIAVFVSAMYKKFTKQLEESEQPDVIAMVNTHLTQKTAYLGTAIIGFVALVFADISSQMSFWWGIGNMIFGFGGIAVIVAIALTKDLESSLYVRLMGEEKK